MTCAAGSDRRCRAAGVGRAAGGVSRRLASARGGASRFGRAARGAGRGGRDGKLRAARQCPRGGARHLLRPAGGVRVCAGSKPAPSGLSLQFTPFEIAERLRGYVEAPALCLGVHLRHARHRRGFLAFRGAHRPAGCAHAADRQPVRLRRAGAHLSAAGHARTPASGLRGAFHRGLRALARGQRRARLSAVHQLSRAEPKGSRRSKAQFPDPPFPVLVQGQAPREALLDRFRELGNAVLLATGSFWEGVDVKGEALSIVAIDKLPFAAPDDPLLQGAPRGHSPARRQSLPRVPVAAGGARAETGRRPPDPRFR